MYSYGPLHTDEQVFDDQLEHIYSSFVSKKDVVYKACQEWWTIETGGERSGKSMLAVRHDDDDIHINVYIYIYIYKDLIIT